MALLLIEPWTFPVALLCFAHAWAVPSLQARRGARSIVPIGSAKNASAVKGPGGAQSASAGVDPEGGPERVALGLLADLVGRQDLDLLRASGMAVHRGRLGVWLVGEQGAILVRPRGRLFGRRYGRRVFCWCVKVGDPSGLPAADRVAHLLLALREDEEGFATVANNAFSGASWRVGRHLGESERAALAAISALS